MTRLDRALALRDQLLVWLAAHGEWETIDEGRQNLRCIAAAAGDFHISYRTPFTLAPDSKLKPKNYRQALLLQQAGPLELGYGLDIWYQNRKVMNLMWSAREETHLAGFRGGLWERELIVLIERAGAAGPVSPSHTDPCQG